MDAPEGMEMERMEKGSEIGWKGRDVKGGERMIKEEKEGN